MRTPLLKQSFHVNRQYSTRWLILTNKLSTKYLRWIDSVYWGYYPAAEIFLKADTLRRSCARELTEELGNSTCYNDRRHLFFIVLNRLSNLFILGCLRNRASLFSAIEFVSSGLPSRSAIEGEKHIEKRRIKAQNQQRASRFLTRNGRSSSGAVRLNGLL